MPGYAAARYSILSARFPATLLAKQEVLQEVVSSPDLGKRGEALFVGQVVTLLLVAFPPPFLRPLLDAAGYAAIAGGLALLVAGQQVRQHLTACIDD